MCKTWSEFMNKDKALLSLYDYYMSLAKKQNNHLHNKAKNLTGQSGLDSNLLGIHPHNAMVSFNQGNPWDSIDYNMVTKVQKILLNQQWLGHNAIRAWYDDRSSELWLGCPKGSNK